MLPMPPFIPKAGDGAPKGLLLELLLPPKGLAAALAVGAPIEEDDPKVANGLLIAPVVGAGRSTVNDDRVWGADPNWG